MHVAGSAELTVTAALMGETPTSDVEFHFLFVGNAARFRIYIGRMNSSEAADAC